MKARIRGGTHLFQLIMHFGGGGSRVRIFFRGRVVKYIILNILGTIKRI